MQGFRRDFFRTRFDCRKVLLTSLYWCIRQLTNSSQCDEISRSVTMHNGTQSAYQRWLESKADSFQFRAGWTKYFQSDFESGIN